MKYFLQLEGQEKLLVKCVFIAQIIIILLLIKMAFRPIELYISNDQLKEIYSWQKRSLKEPLQKETVAEEPSD